MENKQKSKGEGMATKKKSGGGVFAKLFGGASKNEEIKETSNVKENLKMGNQAQMEMMGAMDHDDLGDL